MRNLHLVPERDSPIGTYVSYGRALVEPCRVSARECDLENMEILSRWEFKSPGSEPAPSSPSHPTYSLWQRVKNYILG